MNDTIQMVGNVGVYVNDDNIISFQMGNNPMDYMPTNDPLFTNKAHPFGRIDWLSINGYNVASRGDNNTKCDEIESDIINNRLLPGLINKQVDMLYGQGPCIYQASFKEGKRVKVWCEEPSIQAWLESWESNGIDAGYKDFALSVIKNFYYFHDYFVKWRMSKGALFGYPSIAGMESLETKNCRLATDLKDVVTNLVNYSDFRYILVGNWLNGASKFSVYPKFNIREVSNYLYAAISHHRERAVGSYYGVNETHEGALEFIKGSNYTARYINSFLKNSLAAKIHIVVPNAWMEAKRKQIKALCDENKKRETNKDELLKYNGIEIGTSYSETFLIKAYNIELRKISAYLSGVDNQGKAYSTISFKTGNNEEERWKIETVDLKYKEYIDALISYDKRADAVLASSVGIDPSISGISQDGIISKSGADAYYNYLIYLMNLTPDDDKCAEPFNIALQINFPKLYASGYRIGFYREVPARQEDVSPKDRMNKQQS